MHGPIIFKTRRNSAGLWWYNHLQILALKATRAPSEHIKQHPRIINRVYRWPANPQVLPSGVQSLWTKVILSPTPSGNKYLTILTNALGFPCVPPRGEAADWCIIWEHLLVLGHFFVIVMKFQDKFASLRQKTAPLAEISLKYVELTCVW